MSWLEVRNLKVEFHNQAQVTQAVKGITFAVEEGEIVGLVGESGSGKSSAMLALLGLLPETARVTVEKIKAGEIDVASFTGSKKREGAYEKALRLIRGKKIAMIFQDPAAYLDPAMRIGKQITETIRGCRKCTEAEAREEAEELLDMVGIRYPKRRMRQYPFELSGGMRQRVVIAIALACHPRLLIADEPTTALDVTVQRQVLSVLKRAAKETGTAVLLVSHDLGVIASSCSRVLVMREGEIVEEGSVEDIFYEPQHPYTRKLMEDAEKLQGRVCRGEEKEMLLRLDCVTLSYEKEREAVKELSFALRRGETFGLVGESGCGKTTLARLVTGLLKPEAGHIYFRGEEIGSSAVRSGRRRKERQQRVQMVFQNPYASLNPRMRIGTMLEDVLAVNGISGREERKKRVWEALEMVGLSREDGEKYPAQFSGGQRQRIAIARAFLLDSELIVLDEALSALDLSIQMQVIELLQKIQREKGTAYLFISHDLQVVHHISRKMGVMYQGRIVESGDTEAICTQPWHPYTKKLLEAGLPPDPLKARRKRQGIVTERTENRQKNHGEGCPYAGRCGYALERCLKEQPGNYRFGTREIACFLYSDKDGSARKPDYEMTSQI